MNFKEYQNQLRTLLKKMNENELRGYIWHQLMDIQDDSYQETALAALKRKYQMPDSPKDALIELARTAHGLIEKWTGLSEKMRCLKCWIDEEKTSRQYNYWDDEYVYVFSDPLDLCGLVDKMSVVAKQCMDLQQPLLAKRIILTLVDHPLYTMDENGELEDGENSYSFLYDQDQLSANITKLWDDLLLCLLEDTSCAIEERMAGLPERTKEINGSLYSLKKAVKTAKLTKDERQKAAIILAESSLADFNGTSHTYAGFHLYDQSSTFEEYLGWIFDETQRNRLFQEGLRYFPDLATWYFDTYYKEKDPEEQAAFIDRALKDISQDPDKNKKEQARLYDRLARIYGHDRGSTADAALKQAFLLQPALFRYYALIQNDPDADQTNVVQQLPKDSGERKLYSLLEGNLDPVFEEAQTGGTLMDFCLLLSMLNAGNQKEKFLPYQANMLSMELSDSEVPEDVLLENLFDRAKKRASLTPDQKIKIMDLASSIAIEHCQTITRFQERGRYYEAAQIASLCIGFCHANSYPSKATDFSIDLERMYRRYPKFRKACQSYGIRF